jgi:peptidoglycan/LPS O-acetylase OafA/YrhL
VSFCFYLVHELAILNLRPYLGGLELAVASLLGAVAGACLLHHCIELPMQRVLRPKGQRAVGSEGAIAIRRAAV